MIVAIFNIDGKSIAGANRRRNKFIGGTMPDIAVYIHRNMINPSVKINIVIGTIFVSVHNDTE
ncbi:hypothetical protein SDC9_52250 [bioreactor metagenome]|uniref:Uncharacterized protein n=1 Tax=bioreactor metagenome TaxID=1076179 RepID=A0A644WPZ7_9ZZZZ